MGTSTKNKQRSKKAGKYFALLCFGCFLFSLLVHLFFFHKATSWKITGFSPESYDTVVPRTFRMKRVEIDQKVLDEEKVRPSRQETPTVPVVMQKEVPQIEHTVQAQKESILAKPTESIPIEKPQAQPPGLDSLLGSVEKAPSATAAGSLPEEITEKPVASGTEATIKLPTPEQNDLIKGSANGDTSAAGGAAGAKFSNLDDLLAGTGEVKKDTAPILMPTDLLFEYDSDQLKEAAMASLAKLGSLIKRNEKAAFCIEGHTDSFGTDEYNNGLSLRRAVAVKNWLSTNMGIDASRINTIGLGKSKLLVPATGSVEQQQLNRRVEIVITVPK